MIFGMAEPFQHAMAAHGRRVRLYTPVGRLLPGMAYLVRRLLENTSNESWLRAGFLDDASPDAYENLVDRLLADPIIVDLAQTQGRAVALEVEGHDGVDTICRGRHHRFVVDVKATEARLAAKAAKAGLVKP
jgi:hypothetical protein